MRGLFLVLLAFATVNASAAARRNRPPDLPPDATTTQLWNELNNQGFQLFGNQPGLTRSVIEEAIALGIRNMNWLKFINDRRPDGDKISLTSKATTGGHPIEKPSEYSPKIVEERLEKLRTDMPNEMSEVLFNNKAFTEQPPLEVDKFIEWGRKSDSLYQTALRWQGMQQWLPWLEQNRSEDIHGIYFFNKMLPVDINAKLSAPAQWTAQQKIDFSDWLVSMCLNNGASLNTCRTQVETAANGTSSVFPLFQQWRAKSQLTWDGFFNIQGRRSDIHITNLDLLEMPFRNPNDATILAFLKDNIEDEWHFGTWFLKMVFTPSAAAHVVFRPGVTPHVNGLGGDEITMNSDQPLTEYDAQWTIRHEFGHVLGLPDCYVEYYDSERESIVNYQLDIDNLMCSRHGHIQQKHVDELIKTYKSVEPRLN